MSKILGLDLGTNSIGWAILEKDNQTYQLDDNGVLIFSEGVKKEKTGEKSRAAERTGFRGARRLNFRRKIRKYQTLLVLAKYDMCPLTIEDVKEWRNSNFKKYPTRPEFLDWLQTDNFGEKDNPEHKTIRKRLQNNPYYFRDKASREKIDKLQLGRALYHMAQRRGFLSNRLDQSDDTLIKSKKDEIQDLVDNTNLTRIEFLNEIETVFESHEFKNKRKKDCANATEEKLWSIRKYIVNVIENKIKDKDYSDSVIAKKEIDRYINKPENLGPVQGNISELNNAISEANCKTLGQYFWKLYQQDRNALENKIRINYTSREEHYFEEFEIICKTQGLNGVDKSKKDANKRYSGIVQELYKAIFYQRPLKSQKGLVGKCSLEPNRPRCSVSRPEFEAFRMHSFINNIKVKQNGELRRLTKDEKNTIITKFYRKSKPTFPFEDIKNVLDKDRYYNYKDKATVSGCPTIANLINVFGKDWKDIIFENYTDKTIKCRKTGKIKENKTKDDVVADIWHVLSSYTSDEKLKEFALKKLNADKATANKFSKIHLKKDYANLSLYAIKKILPYLNGEKADLLYPHAVFMANMNKVVKKERWGNKEDRELIEKEIGNIINNHKEDNKTHFAINSLLKKCYDEKFTYSKEAELSYKSDINAQLKKEFGNKTWDKKDDKENILNFAFCNFIKKLKEGNFLKIKRIDDKVMEFLFDNDLLEEKTSDNLYHPSDIEKFKPETIKDKEGNTYKGLGRPDVGSIKNPMAMRALHQLKRLINTLIMEEQIDEHTKINIELSRQLNDANKRKAIEKWQNDRKELYKVYAEKIKELYPKENNGKTLENLTDSDIEKFGFVLEQRKDGKTFTKEDVEKYSLWEEQNHICLYTGKTINLSSFLGKNPQFDIEHTLPRSRSWDNSQKNKTLCDNKFNRDVKQNNIPTELADDKYSKILPRIKHWKENYEDLYKDIQKLKAQSRNAADKEQKDKIIQKRHYLQMEYDYWKGKYDRFTMEGIKEGFKNSQAVDIGIISKYARAYLKSVFNKVYSVKGEMVAEYRKAWGVNITTQDEYGKEVKDRSNHIHHCVDAVTIACMDKKKYDVLAHAWGLEDKGNFEKAKTQLAKEKPWDDFAKDVRNLKNEVFVVHHNKNVLPIQTKKKFRKRGKIQYRFVEQLPSEFKNKKEGKDYFETSKNGQTTYKIPIFLQGDTVRGSLHQKTYYGVVKQPVIDKDGKVEFNNDKSIRLIKDPKTGNDVIHYVIRRELSKLKKTEIKNIIDNNIKDIIEQAAKNKLITFSESGAKVVEEGIWQNKEKRIPLKKVRIFTTVKSPLQDFKKHAKPFLSKHKYKQQFNVVNDENYCMAIYEGKNEKGKTERAYELVNNIEAGEYYKLNNKKDRKQNNISLIPQIHLETGYKPLMSNGKPIILLKGQKVLLLNDENEAFNFKNDEQIKNRLYTITGLDKDGIKVIYHQESRSNTDSIAFMNNVIDTQKLLEVKDELQTLNKWEEISAKFKDTNIKKADVFKEVNQVLNTCYKENNELDEKGKLKHSKIKKSSLTTPKGGDVINRYDEFPYVKFKVSNFNALIENIDFKISITGKIKEL